MVLDSREYDVFFSQSVSQSVLRRSMHRPNGLNKPSDANLRDRTDIRQTRHRFV